MKMFWNLMQEVKLRRDYGVARTQEKWAGNYLTEEAYDLSLIHI